MFEKWTYHYYIIFIHIYSNNNCSPGKLNEKLQGEKKVYIICPTSKHHLNTFLFNLGHHSYVLLINNESQNYVQKNTLKNVPMH